jgi:hypothetical protein
MRIPIQTLLTFVIFLFLGGCYGEKLYLSVQANPSTFQAVGDTITFTYTVVAEDRFDSSKPWGLTDDAADSAPSCGSLGGDYMRCTATHVITTEDVARGSVTSHAVVNANVVGEGYFGDTNRDLTANAQAIVSLTLPTPTVTPVATVDASANAQVTFEKGNTTELADCSGTEFAFNVTDPQGVKQVYLEFAVAGFTTDFSTIATTLDLTNTGGDTWSGTFNDTVSKQGQVTYWRVVVVDNNGIKTVYDEEGKFSFYARTKGCN